MDATDIADELAVEEDPHIVVAEEVVLQRANIVLGQLELDLVLHTEHVVVIKAVVAGREELDTVRTGILATVPIVTGQTIFTLIIIHGPEVIGPDVSVGRIPAHRIVELLKTIKEGALVVIGNRAERIRVTLAIEPERPAVVGGLTSCVSIIEQIRRVNIPSVLDVAITIEPGHQPERSSLQVVISIGLIELVKRVAVPALITKSRARVDVAKGELGS